MKKGELLETLRDIKLFLKSERTSWWDEKDEQAYQQIKEMIQAYAEHQELTANYIDIVIDLYDQLEKKKPQVTEEWIEEKATELFAKHSIGFPTPKMIVILKDFVHELLMR